MDGSGYPHGLKGDQIPLMARVIAVADTFDAMTHNRTYQDAMDGAYVIRIIRTMAGRKFDEHAVEAFCRAYSAGLIELPKRHVDDPEFRSPLVPDPSRIPALVLSDEALQSPSLVTAGGVDTLKV
jgi:HD-GYP domain-containing protein (c-di-GMP phosphodiesterase class II)